MNRPNHDQEAETAGAEVEAPPHAGAERAAVYGVRVTGGLAGLALCLLALAGWFVLGATVLREDQTAGVERGGLIRGVLAGLVALGAWQFHLQLRRDAALRARVGDFVYRLGPTGPLGAAWAVMPAVAGFVLLWSITPVTGWLLDHPELGLAVYVGVFVVAAGLGLLPTYAQAIVGGWAFGPYFGWPVALAAALAGFTGASLVGYFVSVKVAGHRVEGLIDEEARWRAVRHALVESGFWRTLGIVTLVRVPPNSPFALTNLVLSTSGVRLLPYTVGTAVGMTPRTAAAVILATAAAASGGQDVAVFLESAKKNWVLVALAIGGTVVALGVIALVANRALARATAGGGGAGRGGSEAPPAV